MEPSSRSSSRSLCLNSLQQRRRAEAELPPSPHLLLNAGFHGHAPASETNSERAESPRSVPLSSSLRILQTPPWICSPKTLPVYICTELTDQTTPSSLLCLGVACPGPRGPHKPLLHCVQASSRNLRANMKRQKDVVQLRLHLLSPPASSSEGEPNAPVGSLS